MCGVSAELLDCNYTLQGNMTVFTVTIGN